MNRPFPDLSSPDWQTPLVVLLNETATAIARLDERISVSSMTSAWYIRAGWIGYAEALRGQGMEIEEIDIFSMLYDLPQPTRPQFSTTAAPLSAYESWIDRSRRKERQHWTDGLPFHFTPPEDWDNRPALLRALQLQSMWARADRSFAPWLELPFLLQRMGITKRVIPLLVAADKAVRIGGQSGPAMLTRQLKQLHRAADDGLEVLQALERLRVRISRHIASRSRPGALGSLAGLFMLSPLLTPREVAERFGLTISGAGKLLEKASQAGLCHEISGRRTWRSYCVADLATRFGFVAGSPGRPLASRPDEATHPLSETLQSFDDEMARFDALMIRLGLSVDLDKEDDE